jgi:hypothetical protein
MRRDAGAATALRSAMADATGRDAPPRVGAAGRVRPLTGTARAPNKEAET